MEFELEQIHPGQRAVITYIPENHPLKSRLRGFGFVPDAQISCPFLSPGGDLTALEICGSMIAVRAKDLRGIVARRC